MSNEFKFNSGNMAKAKDEVQKKLFINRLPEWMQGSEQIQAFCDDVIQQWFTPQEQVLVDGYIGDRGSPVAAGKIFLPEMNTARQEYQLSPAYVSRNPDTSVRSLQFYPDTVGYLKHYGALTTNENRLMSGNFYSWTPPINPNKFVNFSSYLWDMDNEYGIQPDYVVMERNADNGNIWSLQNFWYTIGQTLPDGTILTEELSMTSRFKRAQAPIISFNKNIELQNYGTQFRGTVDYFSTSMKPEDIVQRKISDDIRVDGFILKAGDRIMFTSIGNPGENNRIYRIVLDTMQDGTKVYGVVLDETEETELRPSGEPLNGDTILVRYGNEYANIAFYWNGKMWVRAQEKPSINTFPKFNLYDKDGVILNDTNKYPGSTFNGSSLFGLKINYSFPEDKIYNSHVELSSYNYYVFENFLQTIKYTYMKTGVPTEIGGLYYYSVNEISEDNKLVKTIKSDWVRNESVTKQYVRQVPVMKKKSMFRVFNTLFEMNGFKEPLTNMYAYVVETDQNYRYFKRDNSNFESWNPITMDSIQSDVYDKVFDIAQRIDPQNPEEEIEVYLDGEQLQNDVDYILDENGNIETVVLGDSYKLKETSIVNIRTYSPTKEFDSELGSFEIPINLKNNPYNEGIDYINQGNYTLHFLDIIRQNITRGSVSDLNDYEERLEKGLVNNAVGTQIIQNEAPMLPLMLHTANDDLNIFESIMFCEAEYFRFKNKFTNKMLEMYNENPSEFLNELPSTLVDMIINSINIGKNDTFPFAFSNVGSNASVPRTYIAPTPQFLGILQSYRPQKSTPMFVGKHIGRYNVDHCGVVSKSYVNINGIGLMDDVIYELEQRIYNSIDNSFKSIDFVPNLNSISLEPTAHNQNTEYSRMEYNSLLLRGYTNFLATNAIDGSTHNYDPNNWMTWNFSGSTYIVDGKPSNIKARASWRAIYTDMYGTFRPYSHPWEMFGFTQRPEWFNLEYKPTKVRLSEDVNDYVYVYEAFVLNENGDMVESGLWDTDKPGAASTGYIAGGSRQGFHPEFRHFGKQPFTIHDTGDITTDGEKIQEIKLLSPMEGMISGALIHRAEPWAIGDMGDMEFTYMNTPMFAFEKAMTLLRAKPAQFCSYFYDTRGSILQNVNNTGYQFLYADTNRRLNFSSKTLVHSEDKGRILGYQTWVSDFLINQNKNVQLKYGDVLRSSYINVGHRLGAFSKVDQLTFSSDSFGLVSQENQHIGLVKSSVLKESTMSAVKITYNGSGYIISGYDLVSPFIPYYKPKKTSRRHTINVGKKSILHYNDYESTVHYLPYDSVLNTVQEVYELLCSYGRYLENSGWIYEEYDENGEINNWNQIAKSFVNWSSTKVTKGEFISVSPSTKAIKFGLDFGSVQSVTQYSGGVWTLLDDKNRGIRPDEIDTTRIGNVFSVRMDDDVNKRIALIRLNTISYEHAVVFDDVTIFGDNIYIPKYGSVHEMIKMYGYTTGSWNGRLEAPGFMILESGTLPNFEKLVQDFTQYYNNDVPVDNSSLKELSRHLIGFQTRDYIREMISNESSQIDFYRGYIKEKGTQQAFEKVLRVSKTYNTENYKALEEWAFKVGTYGNVNGKKHLQFQLSNNKFKQEPQLFKFDENATKEHSDESLKSSTILYYGKQGDDLSWVYRPNNKFSFPVRTGKSTRINLPDIGPVSLGEVDFSTTNFTTITDARFNYINTYLKAPKNVWMYRDDNDQWNIYDIKESVAVLTKIEPIDDDEYNGISCKLIFDKAHGLNDGDYYFLSDETEFMPDTLKNERQYYAAAGEDNEIVLTLDIKSDINFDSGTEPKLYTYVNHFATEKEKTDYVNKKYSYPAPESALFERSSTYNSTNNMTELYLNTYDPINGVIPGTVMSEITYITTVDPAQYNSNESTIEAWGKQHVGKVWWDTTSAFYLDYTRPVLDSNGNVLEKETLEYKRANWGKLLPESEINMYEWVRSPVEPFEWDSYCTKQAKLNKDVTSWVPSGDAIEDSFSMFNEYDPITSEYKMFYYFWVRNPIYIPKILERTKSVNELVRILIDPSVLNTPWFSPISSDSFICSNLSKNITDDKSILTISYQNDSTEVIKHEQYQLCKEGLDYNFNPNVWNTLMNSLIGFETINGVQNDLLYPKVELGCQPGKTWFKDIVEARRTFTHTANNIFKSINMITNSVIMNDVFNVKTTERNPNLIDIKILSFNNEFVILPTDDRFKENDAVMVSSTGTLPEPLNSNEVYFVHFDENGYIKLMRSPSSTGNTISIIPILDKGEGSHAMIKQSDYIESLGTSLDMTQYWEYTDWYSVGYDDTTSYVKEVSLDAADQKNYQEGDIIRVVGSDGIWTLYVKIFSRSVTMWQAIGRQNSTVRLNNRLFDYDDMYDSLGNPTPRELNVRNALALLGNSFESVQSRMVFDMVKYVHTEQNVVDWVFKTSFIYVIGLEQSLQRSYLEQDNLINQIVAYFEETKPYRTKIRSQIEQKTSDEDEVNGISNDLDPNGYIFVNGKWIKTENDIWDYEYAEKDVNGKWVKHGELPSDFVTPNRRFQEMNTVLQFDNVQCKPSSNLKDVNTLETNNNKFVSTRGDLLGTNEHYVLQRMEFTTPVLAVESTAEEINTLLHLEYPWIVSVGLQDSVNEVLVKYKDDIDSTEAFQVKLDEITNTVYGNSININDIESYVQYNTLANRSKLYTNKSDDDIAREVGCPFKGKFISDNPSTRLPFGYSASSDYNFGYIHWGTALIEKFISMVEAKYPNENIDDILMNEYGVYRWADNKKTTSSIVDEPELDDEGNPIPVYDKNFSDALTMLTLTMNIVNKDEDHYDRVKQILMNAITLDSDAIVIIPRKYVVCTDPTDNKVLDIPLNVSIEEFMESYYNLHSVNVKLQLSDTVLDDLALSLDSPLLSDYNQIIEGINDAKFYNDMNSFDNLALESQTKKVVKSYRGNIIDSNDSIFMDISELNPNKRDIAQLRFTVNGYNYDEISNIALKDTGNFQIEGKVILNPYNRSEVMISIPRYSEAIEYMNKDLISHNEIKYMFNCKAIKDNTVTLIGADLKVGEKVALFTSNASDYEVLDIDYNWITILAVDEIKENNRPKLYTVLSVDGDVYELDGFKATVDMSVASSEMLESPVHFGITAVRVTSFRDDEFVKTNTTTGEEISLYSNYREYAIDALDYDVFYDRWFAQADYTVVLHEDDLDGWYCTNEIGILEDGTEVDHGYYLPIYGQGALSELTRIKPLENIQIYVYEYDSTEIGLKGTPRSKKSKFKYDKALVSDVYYPNASAKLSVLYNSTDIAVSRVSYPKSVGNFVYNTGKLRGDVTKDDIVVVSGAMMHSIDGSHVLRGIHNSVEYSYPNNVDVELYGINLGKETEIKDINYLDDYNQNNGTVIESSDIEKLLKN